MKKKYKEQRKENDERKSIKKIEKKRIMLHSTYVKDNRKNFSYIFYSRSFADAQLGK